MALRSTNTQAPAFEPMNSDVVAGAAPATAQTAAATPAQSAPWADQQQPESPAAEAAPADQAAPASTSPQVTLAIQPTTAVAAPRALHPLAAALRSNSGLDDLQDVIGPDMLEAMGYGAFSRITVDNGGGFNLNKTEKQLGSWLEFQLMSWNNVWMVTTGAQNNPEANKKVRTSRDKVNLEGGQGLVTAYVAQLKAEGYKEASVKQYVEIYGLLTNSERGGEVPEDDRKLMQISASPQSVTAWGVFLLTSRMMQGQGKPVPSHLRILGKRKTLGPNTFGIIEFGFVK